MKLAALIVTAALAASATPAFADDLCAINLQKLNDILTTEPTLAEPMKMQVEEHKKEAEKAQSAGDLEACGTHAEKALQLLDAPGDQD